MVNTTNQTRYLQGLAINSKRLQIQCGGGVILLGGRIQGYSRGLEEIAEDDLCAGLVWIILESVFSNFVDALSSRVLLSNFMSVNSRTLRVIMYV